MLFKCSEGIRCKTTYFWRPCRSHSPRQKNMDWHVEEHAMMLEINVQSDMFIRQVSIAVYMPQKITFSRFKAPWTYSDCPVKQSKRTWGNILMLCFCFHASQFSSSIPLCQGIERNLLLCRFKVMDSNKWQAFTQLSIKILPSLLWHSRSLIKKNGGIHWFQPA